MKKNVFRRLYNRAICSLLVALGFYSHPTSAKEYLGNDNQYDGDSYTDPDDETPIPLYGAPVARFLFHGNVTDQNNNPLPGVSVEMKKCNAYTYDEKETDNNGEFSIAFIEEPWCDITLSFTKDPSTKVDTTIRVGYIEKDEAYIRDKQFFRIVNVIFPTDGKEPLISLRPTELENIMDVEEPIRLITNLVDDYMWMNFREESSADVQILDMEGVKKKETRMTNDEPLYIGDLISGHYILKATSGQKRFSTIFIKK